MKKTTFLKGVFLFFIFSCTEHNEEVADEHSQDIDGEWCFERDLSAEYPVDQMMITYDQIDNPTDLPRVVFKQDYAELHHADGTVEKSGIYKDNDSREWFIELSNKDKGEVERTGDTITVHFGEKKQRLVRCE